MTSIKAPAAAFAAHYGFSIDVLAAYRPTGKGRVERQVGVVREHVLAARDVDSVGELDAAFTQWLPLRLAQVHRTHGEAGVAAVADRTRIYGKRIIAHEASRRWPLCV